MPWSKVVPEIDGAALHALDEQSGARRLTYAEAVQEAFDQALAIDPRAYLMGQGVNDPKGMFGTTVGLRDKHGDRRVFDTPLAENGLMGIAVGSAIAGQRPIYLHNRPDFLLLALDQLANHAAKWSFMTAGQVSVPLVVWACIGRGWGSAAQHSQALQATFAHFPGLKVVAPGTAYDAKGLLMSAVADPDPVVVIEHRYNFKLVGPVPEEPYLVPIGKGVIRRRGADLTIVTSSQLLHESFVAAGQLAREGIEAEIVDLRTLKPFDAELVLESVSRTGRLLVADTGWKTCGYAAEIAALVAEEAFDRLRAPVRRVCSADVPTPAGYTLEQAFYIGAAEIAAAARATIDHGALVGVQAG
jgi:pyruvate dehydrogenase E1 component beta subunit